MVVSMADWIPQALAGSLTGLVLGAVYFQLLRRATLAWAGAAPTLAAVLAGAALRVAGAVAVFVLLMIWSATAAIFGLLGFALARQWIVMREKSV